MKSLWRRVREKREDQKAARYTKLDELPPQEGEPGKPRKPRLSTKDAVKRFRAHALVEEKSHRDVVRVGLRDSVWTDLYHHALTASWPAFAYTAVLSYFLVNLFFALLYWLAPDQVTGDSKHTLLSLFFFSVQTLSTVGYGGMVPVGLYSNIVVTFEVLIGMMINALATGVVFARFARPRARIMFSNTAVISNENGVPALCIRIANLRMSVILSVDVEVALSRLVMVENGHLVRQFDQLLVVQSHVPVLKFAFVMAHVIGPDSPLHGKTVAELEHEEAEIVVTVTGTDEALGQTVFARTAYRFDKVRHNHRFVDIVASRPDGRIAVDYTRFHDIEEH
ncbi:ATP-sensitive potassium transporter [Acetobacter indonesiensis NRIC 0313]|uniref:ATP-sensitive potassium channel protein n=1 Tax=Acetobacter indonesiensis TaxID=104101 RepID=A0A252AXD8_9PROT|nr:ion channel [Acetobacter indonesiensis]MCG0994056.1 ion channel [Acetobacter indonesiensis]OUI95272.1 ATP-sensitive potassium channel protein [Acetobacter indonesiensis]GAN62855.1 ATP-sensitive potassium transporter [Acetobacter indonesiensis]GBQ54335.1 ATP-sensitive potassium transporter [Acetobacter indonesiensis NRIC 0313]GEN02424.1 inward rectifier potassium channel protein [Acetobacter indonesiensis]